MRHRSDCRGRNRNNCCICICIWFMYSIVFYITSVVLSCVLSTHNKRILYCIVLYQVGDDRRYGRGSQRLHSSASDGGVRSQRGAAARRHRHSGRQWVGTWWGLLRQTVTGRRRRENDLVPSGGRWSDADGRTGQEIHVTKRPWQGTCCTRSEKTCAGRTGQESHTGDHHSQRWL